jgi:hypothetical protein
VTREGRRWIPLAAASVLLLAAGGCTPFVGVATVSLQGYAREANALNGDRLSTASRNNRGGPWRGARPPTACATVLPGAIG